MLPSLTFGVIADFALGVDLDVEECPAPFQSFGELWSFLLHESMGRVLWPVKYWRWIKTSSARKFDVGLSTLTKFAHRSIEARLAQHRYDMAGGSRMPSFSLAARPKNHVG